MKKVVLVKVWVNLKGINQGLFFEKLVDAKKYIKLYNEELALLEKNEINEDMLGNFLITNELSNKIISFEDDINFSKHQVGDIGYISINEEGYVKEIQVQIKAILELDSGY